MSAMGDEPLDNPLDDLDDLDDDQLSLAALELAKRAATDGVDDDLLARAQAMAAQVRQRLATADDDAARTLTDAQLDVDWVRSRCSLPTSTRLHWFLEERST
jgi:hypothetical protein